MMKRNRHKIYGKEKTAVVVFFSFFLSLFFQACGPSFDTTEITQSIRDVKMHYAPDKRVAVFNIEAKASPKGFILLGETNIEEAKNTLLEELNAKELRVIDSIEILPAKELEGDHFGVVRLSVGNIRSQPKHSAELATQAMLGTPLRIYKKSGGWYLVQTPDEYLGWLDSGGLELMNEASFQEWMDAEKVIYIHDNGFSYAGPNTKGTKVSDLLAGNMLLFEEMEGGFAKIKYPDGRIAYIPASEVMGYKRWLDSRNPDAANILSAAREFIGRPYLWGGTSGKGLDCSGFTKTVYFLNGLLLPRDASQQVHIGEEISTDGSWENLLPGDLLFFGRKATDEKPERITHVAIYLGDGKIIHSSGSVQIESLNKEDDSYNESRFSSFVRAKRILNSLGENGVHLLRDSPFYK